MNTDLRHAQLKANLEYEASRERFKQKRIQLRIEETQYEIIRPPKNKKQTPKKVLSKTSEYNILFKRQNGICALCKLRFGKSRGTVDHIVPKSKGGSNDISNKQLTHRWCNNVKGDSQEILSPAEYQTLASELKERVYAKKEAKKTGYTKKGIIKHLTI